MIIIQVVPKLLLPSIEVITEYRQQYDFYSYKIIILNLSIFISKTYQVDVLVKVGIADVFI